MFEERQRTDMITSNRNPSCTNFWNKEWKEEGAGASMTIRKPEMLFHVVKVILERLIPHASEILTSYEPLYIHPTMISTALSSCYWIYNTRFAAI